VNLRLLFFWQGKGGGRGGGKRRTGELASPNTSPFTQPEEKREGQCVITPLNHVRRGGKGKGRREDIRDVSDAALDRPTRKRPAEACLNFPPWGGGRKKGEEGSRVGCYLAVWRKSNAAMDHTRPEYHRNEGGGGREKNAGPVLTSCEERTQ